MTPSVLAADARTYFEPTYETLNIFPAKVKGIGFANLETILFQNLSESVLYQGFTESNSAHLSLEQVWFELGEAQSNDLTSEADADMTATNTATRTAGGASTSSELTSDTTLSSSTTGELTTPVADPVDAEVITTDVSSSGAPESAVEMGVQTSTATQTDSSVVSMFRKVWGIFRFTQAQIFGSTSPTSSVPQSASTSESLDSSPATTSSEGSAVQFGIATRTQSTSTVPPVDVVAGTENVTTTTASSTVTQTNQTSPESVVVTATATESVTATNGTATSTRSNPEVAPDMSAAVDPVATNTTHQIVMSDFGVPDLERGQFIDAIQLRISLAGQYTGPTTSLPTLNVNYTLGTFSGSSGAVIITDQVSNAINGGYALVALPSITDPSLLKDLELTLSLVGGDPSNTELFIDAAWVEVKTAVYDKELLKKRYQKSALDHLGPKSDAMFELISDGVDFTRTETPYFTLRYESQRNVVVRTFRDLIGRDVAEIKRVTVLKKGVQPFPIKPQLNITKDGLITVQFDDADQAKLEPGTYELEFVIDEGGKEFTDSVSFQWGLLTINTHKTQYDTGEVAQISMGSLTPNGHTVCDADLALYIVNPQDFVSQVPVAMSGQCDGNNVIDVPDYSASFVTTLPGEYEMYLERLDENGNIISHTFDTFKVVHMNGPHTEREGPTRIYPKAPYPMEITVHAPRTGFSGQLIERVPGDFEVFNTDADIQIVDGYQELRWDVALLASSTRTFSYEFDAPDISPYLYTLGPAALVSSDQVSASTSSSATDFLEHRQWQIASDAVGAMIMFYDGTGGDPAPPGWNCISCNPGDDFYERFVMGSSTYGIVGGTATHTHTAVGSVDATLDAAVSEPTPPGSGNIAENTHGHSYTPSVDTVDHRPPFRQLRVIEFGSLEEPAEVPTGAIGIFDIASSSLPSGWTRYAAQDGQYVLGQNTIGTTGGSATHNHVVDGSTGAADTGGQRNRNGGVGAALETHTHTVSTTSDEVSNEPPYVEVLLARVTATTTLPNGLITMWSEDVPTGWIDVSSSTGDTFTNKFIKPAASFGATGGTSTHAHANILNVLSSQAIGTDSVRSGGAGADDNHDHEVDITDFSTETLLPPYITAVFGKRFSNTPVYEQLSYRWYANENSQTPTDPWPSGATDVGELGPITATSTPVKNGDEIRLRINAAVTNATATAGSSYLLEYATSSMCSAATNWQRVGATGSSTVWRGFNNGSVSDNSALSSTTLSATTIAETYEENGFATNTPNAIPPADVGEWDFVLQQNGAEAGTNYCFRLVEDDGTPFGTYTSYPQLLTNRSPEVPTVTTLFDNEKSASTTGHRFLFVSTDSESERINYQIEIADDYGFSSIIEERDSTVIAEQDQFVDIDVGSKAPFFSGSRIQFTTEETYTNTNTYYWRVRSRDPAGSNQWSNWSTIRSFTIDDSLNETAWYQTETEQFDTNTFVNVAAGNGSTSLTAATGTMTSTAIDFDDGTVGTAWDSLVITESDTANVLDYYLEYLDDSSTWTRIPDVDLPGNAAGFSTTTIPLLTLDVETYNEIRVVADFTANTNNPRLEDWQVNWGFRVETPTIIAPFASEKVGTTTPFFQFSTTDPQNDTLTYQISWSTDITFSASTTRTSDDLSPGFTDLDAGGSDPFPSGNTIQFQIQGGNALQNNETYWWRVRAKDTGGTGAYSFWTDAQSFTVATDTVVSTWYQTSEEQFDSNTLSGTDALANDSLTVATTARTAMIVYGEGTDTIPKSRLWNGTSLGSEVEMVNINASVRNVRVAAGTTREEYIAVTSDSNNDVNAQFYIDGEWGNLQELTLTMGDITTRGFDVAYESLSGDAMVVYCDNDTTPQYGLWNGSSWSTTSASVGITLPAACEWVQLAADPDSDEMIVLTRDADGTDYIAAVWNATTSSWGNTNTLGGITEADNEGMALAYEESGDQGVIAVSIGNQNRFTYDSWNGVAWTGSATFNLGGDFEWGTMVSDVGSDALAVCLVDDADDIAVARWNGAGTWTLSDDLEVSGDKTRPGFACVYEDTVGNDGDILLTYSDTGATNYRTYDSSIPTWDAELQVNSIAIAETMQLERTGDATILGIFFDTTAANDLLFTSWDGSSWAANNLMTNDASVDVAPYGRPYGMAPRNPGTDGTVIVSPPIDFDEGSGPFWESFYWTDVQPIGTSIVYQLQYQTATGSWAFIPDSDLPGNETGTTTGPYDLTGLNKTTYNVIRPYATLTCLDANTCPVLEDWSVEWSGGIDISGTAQFYNQTDPINNGSVAVAINGTIQPLKFGSVSGGAWTITNVTAFAGDIITVFLNGTSTDSVEAVGVAQYDGLGDVTGFQLFENHLSLGSNDATSTPLTNNDIGLYDVNNDEDVFLELVGDTLKACNDTGCDDVRLYVNSSTTYRLGNNLFTHDIQNDGTIIATGTITVTGSWDNNATTSLSGSTVIMAATSSTESIDSTGAAVSVFNNLTFGTTTTASAVWTVPTALDVNGNLTVSRGTLSRGTTEITVAGNLTTEANGFWSGIGTTTFDGSGSRTWADENASVQNVGTVVIDGTAKAITLANNVAAESITIGSDDTLDASASNYNISVYGNWINNNTAASSFNARAGTVLFVATSTNTNIDVGGNAFYNLTFNGVGGGWSFTENTLSVANDLTIATGTVTLPSATTTLSGSFSSAGGQFAHNLGTIFFDSDNPETIVASGTATINAFNNLYFNGGGSWEFLDVHATSSGDIIITQGSATFPSGQLAVEGTVRDLGGSFTGNDGTVRFFSGGSEVITAGGSSFASMLFDAGGSWSFSDTNLIATGDLTVSAGTLTLPTGTFTLGGSLINSSTLDANGGAITFNSNDTGEVINVGGANLADVTFNNAGGGWTFTAPATTTNTLTLSAAAAFDANGQQLAVGGVFTNSVGTTTTDWDGSTLYLYGSTPYSINTKTDEGDSYGTLRIGTTTAVSVWNSDAAAVTVDSGGYVYSQDHGAVDGVLYIYGDYVRTSGSEYWSYATDFDGTNLGTTSARLVDVRFASGATASFSDSTWEVLGSTTASTTIQNQGSGTYTISMSGGTTTARYYDFTDLGNTGVSLLASSTVTSLRDGSFTVAANGGSALTIASTTIDTNPAKQIYNVTFATTTAISAFNVTQSPTSSSYWWFRESKGNLDGEAQDQDPDATGNPGTIRWDDSALQVTIAGSVYDTDESTLLTATTCNAGTPVRVVVQNGATYDGACTGGTYSIGPVTIVGDPIVSVFLNGAADTAVTVTKTVTGNVLDLDLIANRVMTRHEDTAPMTIADLAVYDNGDNASIPYTAATTTDPDQLIVFADHELHIASTTTFAPGGTVTLLSGSGTTYDGSLHIADGATFTGAGTTTYTIGGSFTLGTGATFTPAQTVVAMVATSSGKGITTDAGETLTIHDMQFTGVSGGWNLTGNISATGDITVATGTVSGTGDITLTAGAFSGDGLVSLGSGEVVIASSTTLGGVQGWTFDDLTLGNGILTGTTTPGSTATTTVGGTLTIETAHFLDAGASAWDLSGAGTVLVENGTLQEDTSTFRYSGTAATNILSTDYYNLLLDAGAGAPTYSGTGLGVQVFGNLSIGSTGTTTVDFEVGGTDPALNIDGDFYIGAVGTFQASDASTFTLAGDYDNDGTFTASGGTLTLDGSGVQSIAAGASSFANLTVAASGDVTVTEHATSTDTLTLTSANSFTAASGQVIAIGGTFTNAIGGTATDWSGSTLFLYGGGAYEVNTKAVTDEYETLVVSGSTQVRTWNSVATTTTVAAGSSWYSQDHNDVPGDLYIYGDYVKSSGADYWSNGTDFDGTDLGGSDRPVDVYIAGGGSVTYDGTSQLGVLGAAGASTTIQNQGSGVFSFTATGTASTTMNRYEFRNVDSNGVTFGGSVTVGDLSRGYFLVSNDGDSAMTVTGSALDASPARTFSRNVFATSSGVSTATNVTTDGGAVNSWRFTLHAGDIDGEAFDNDNGDPGYIAWDDSANLITVSGNVYEANGSTVSSACGVTANIHLYVDGNPAGTADCDGGTYTITDVAYGTTSDLVVFIDNNAADGATVSKEPISDILNLDIYEDHVIVRHEGTNAVTIDDMSTYDGGGAGDSDIPFTVSGGDLTVSADTTLMVWNNKEFAPGGDVTISGGGAGDIYDGTLELRTGSTFTANGSESHTVGGSLISGAGSTFTAASSLFTFTSGSTSTIDINDQSFYDVTLNNAAGEWTFTDTILDVNNFTITAGSTTLPSGTTTVSGSFNNSGGTFANNGALFIFDGTGIGETVAAGGSDFAEVRFTGTGSWNMTDTNATATDAVTILDGTVTLPGGVFTIGEDFKNTGGDFTNNSGTVRLTSSNNINLTASGSDLYSVTMDGTGTTTMTDISAALAGDLIINQGHVSFPNAQSTSTLSIAGSLIATGGTFTHATGSVLFNSNDTGEIINPGSSTFYNVVIGNAAGGWTVSGNATATNNFTLSTANTFAVSAGVDLTVENVFKNYVGGAASTWGAGSVLRLTSASEYPINNKTSAGEDYDTLVIAAHTDISSWNSRATTTTVDPSGSFYSQNHGSSSGELYIYGDFQIATTTEYWSYTTDFDGTDLTIGGKERAVTVRIAAGATTTVSNTGSLQIVGESGNETTITNQGSGEYALRVTGGTYNAQYVAYRNLDSSGLTFTGTPLISSLNYNDFELAIDSGSLLTLASTSLNANASKVIVGNRFATTTAISGANVTVNGTTSNAWTFTAHTGNLDGEDYDADGATACGSIRWDDSSCQLRQQTHYRWRDDGGNLGAPDGEWFNLGWTKRQPVRVDNNDATTYTNAVVKLDIPYDSDMEGLFNDLRFTDSSGTTTVPYFIATTTEDTSAEVWVQVPTLPANDTATLYMYYGSTTVTTTSSSTQTFVAADDFEDGDIAEYDGANNDKALFSVTGQHAYGGSFGLDNSNDVTEHADDGGIARFDQTVSQGETIRYQQYVDASVGDDEACFLFGVEDPVDTNRNYAVCLEQIIGTDFIALSRDVVDTDIFSGVTMATSTVGGTNYSTGWYTVEIDWETTGEITVSLYDDTDSLVTTLASTSASYTSGGYGFTFWINRGGWDNVTSREYLTTEPTVRFGAEVGPGGADWVAALDAPGTFNTNDVARLRLAVENSGLLIADQNFDLEFAEKDAAPSCEAVTDGEYQIVPTQGSCGSSPICMQASGNVTDGAATADLLTGTNGAFVAGEARENNSNTTGNITLDQDEFTELEYVVTPTVNATSSAYCFRVTDSSSEFDTYLSVAEMRLVFDPSITNVTFNNGVSPITLFPGTTTRVFATGTVTDLNGVGDLAFATSTMYRSGAGAACNPDNSNCYISAGAPQCTFTDCDGLYTCTVSCYADFLYYADATDDAPYEGEEWLAYIEVVDQQGGTDLESAISGVEVGTMRAIIGSSTITYGSLFASSTWDGNATTSVRNIGNDTIDVSVTGTDMSDGDSSVIPAQFQRFSTTTFDYGSCGLTTCPRVSSTAAIPLEVDLAKPASTTPIITDDIYWGISIPFGVNSAPHTGLNTFIATDD